LDAILALRLLSQVHREFSQPLHVAFVDLKAAFDSVDRLALWKALRGIRIPQYLLQLIEDLLCSKRFEAPHLVSGSVLLSPPVSSPPPGGEETEKYVNQVATLLSQRPPGALEVFETTVSQLGLRISWQKTKIQNLGAGEPTPCPPVRGHSLEEVTEFKYLGSVESTSCRCQPDIIRRIGIASTPMHSMPGLATDPASTADKTSPVPDLYIVHFVVWFRDVDTSAGGSTEAGGLSHALPTYDTRDTLA